MKHSLPHASPRTPTRAPAFTLTEILIALALTALLLVGISRIFAITSTTISTGQALAKAMRSQKAIQTSLSNDFLGVGDLGKPDYQSGMMPLINTANGNYAAPFLSISNFRVAAYKNQADLDGDSTQPTDFTTLNAANFANRSEAIRSQDLNNDGDVADAGEVTPIYSYGERNFRADTIGFFAKGRFDSQTGSDNVVDTASSNEAWVWYGHLRVFNSDATAASAANGYGNPGDYLTPAVTSASLLALPNRNNRFADDFRLGRVVNLLIEPTDIRYDNSNATEAQKVYGDTVVANSDYARPVAFILRDWATPTSTTSRGVTITPNRMSMLPILPSNDLVNNYPGAATYTPGEIFKYDATGTGQNRRLGANSRLETQGATTPYAFAALGRTDVAGSGIKELRSRAAFLQGVVPATWWQTLPNDWDDRYFVNPFPTVPLTAGGLSQRQQILADACPQFIVEYAGDFVKQNDNGTLAAINGTLPDGVLDFAAIPDGSGGFVRQTRWYGLPRDVDGDGQVLSTGAVSGWPQSPDVIPLRDVRGGLSAFERRVPPAVADYMTVEVEPGTATNANATAYVCVWGPADFAPVDVTTAGVTVQRRAVPQLVRLLVDVRDNRGTLNSPLTQEYVFPVRVSAAIEQPQP